MTGSRPLVLRVPATPWFRVSGELAQVQRPILVRCGEKDEITPPPHADIVRHGVADTGLVEYAIVANAGHFSFLSPFPAAMIQPDFPLAHDPPGFDRFVFQPLLQRDIIEFLRLTL